MSQRLSQDRRNEIIERLLKEREHQRTLEGSPIQYRSAALQEILEKKKSDAPSTPPPIFENNDTNISPVAEPDHESFEHESQASPIVRDTEVSDQNEATVLMQSPPYHARREKTVKNAAKRHEEQFTFTPKINKYPKHISRNYSEQSKADQFERLSRINPSQKKKLDSMKQQKEAEETAECTFKPKINTSYKPRKAEVDISHLNKTSNDESFALNNSAYEEASSLILEPKQEYNSNVAPKTIIKKPPRGDQHNSSFSNHKPIQIESEPQSAVKPQTCQKPASARNRAYTPVQYFQSPEATQYIADRNEMIRLGYRHRQGSVPVRIVSHYGKPNDIMDKINSCKSIREQSLDKIRQTKLKQEVSDCTFRPQINQKKLNLTGPVPIKGLDVFYGTKHNAKRLQNEKKDRENRVFGYSYKTRSYTTPKPFNLRSSSRALESRRGSRQDTARSSSR